MRNLNTFNHILNRNADCLSGLWVCAKWIQFLFQISKMGKIEGILSSWVFNLQIPQKVACSVWPKLSSVFIHQQFVLPKQIYQQCELHSVSPERNCTNRAIVSSAGRTSHWFLREDSKGIPTSCPLSTLSSHQSAARVMFWKRKTLHFFSRLSKKSVTLHGK